MRHPLFEEWLFSKETLDEHQLTLLESHKQECETCQFLEKAWNEVSMEMQPFSMEAPDEGFSKRWLMRLNNHKKIEQQKHAFWAFVLTSGASLLFALPLLIFLISTSPTVELWSTIYRMTIFYEYMQGIITFLTTILRPISFILPPILGFMGGFTLWGCFLLWLVVMRKVVIPRRESHD